MFSFTRQHITLQKSNVLESRLMLLCFVAQARVLATIGITRGLGDHDLKVHDSDIAIKPFLSCSPEVCNSLTHT